MTKPRPTLLPPLALYAVAELMAHEDAEHEGGRWRTRSVEHHLDAAERHLLAHLGGTVLDPDSGRPHLVHYAARALMAVDVDARTSEPPGSTVTVERRPAPVDGSAHP